MLRWNFEQGFHEPAQFGLPRCTASECRGHISLWVCEVILMRRGANVEERFLCPLKLKKVCIWRAINVQRVEVALEPHGLDFNLGPVSPRTAKGKHLSTNQLQAAGLQKCNASSCVVVTAM